MSDTAHKMMHQDQSSCPVLKGAGRKTSSGAGKTPNHHPRNHFFHRIIRSAVSTMFVLALLCQTAQSAAEPTFNRVECMGRIRRFKKIERILTNLVKREGEDWKSCDEVIKDVCDYEKWDSDMQGAYLAARHSVEAVINEYIKCGWHRPLSDAIKNDVIKFTNTERTYNQSLEVLTFSCIEALREKVQSHLAKFEKAEEAERKAEKEDETKEQVQEKAPKIEIDSEKLLSKYDNLSEDGYLSEFYNFSDQQHRVWAKYPLAGEMDQAPLKGFLTAFKLTDQARTEMLNAWREFGAYKQQQAGTVHVTKRLSEAELNLKIPKFLLGDKNELLFKFAPENGDHYIISNIQAVTVGTGGLDLLGEEAKSKSFGKHKYIQKVFKLSGTGGLKFYKYSKCMKNMWEEVDMSAPKKPVNRFFDDKFQFMIRRKSALAKDYNMKKDAQGTQNLVGEIKRCCEE